MIVAVLGAASYAENVTFCAVVSRATLSTASLPAVTVGVPGVPPGAVYAARSSAPSLPRLTVTEALVFDHDAGVIVSVPKLAETLP